MVLVGQPAIRAIDAGGNMAAPLLAKAVGGDAVPRIHLRRRVRDDPRGRRRPDAGRAPRRCRTISGSTSCATAPHREREQLRVARASTVVLGVLAIVLGIVFKGQNVAYMVGLAFAIAASANFPALVLSMFWRKFTTRGGAGEHAGRHGVEPAADLPVADDSDRRAEEYRPPGFRCAIPASCRFRCRSRSPSSSRCSGPSPRPRRGSPRSSSVSTRQGRVRSSSARRPLA